MRNIQVGGTSLSFDGVDDYVLVENTGGGDVSQLNFIVEFSINKYTDSTYQYLLALNSATYFNIRNNNGTLFMSLRLNGSQETFSTGYPIKLHKVYRLRVNYTGSSIEVYDLDVDETSPVYSSEASGVLTIDSDIHVGSYVNKGSILSGRIHQITVDGIFDYRMNEGEGNTVIDNSENNNDGTIYGAKWVLPKSVDEVTVWDGSRQRKVIGKIMTEDGLRDFYRPINFETDFIDTQNMALQTASTLTSQPTNAGSTVIPVRSTTKLVAGEIVTITDGVNEENIFIISTGVANVLENSDFKDGSSNWSTQGSGYVSFEEGKVLINNAGSFYQTNVISEGVDSCTALVFARGTGSLIVRFGTTSANGIEVSNDFKWYKFDITDMGNRNIIFETDADGDVEIQKVRLGHETSNEIYIDALQNNYPRNSIVARSTGKIDGAFSYGTRNTYNIEEV